MKRYQDDPLNYHGGIMLGTGSMILDVRSRRSHNQEPSSPFPQMMDTIQLTADKMVFPILLLQGEDDRICDPAGAKKYYEMLPSKDKKLILYPKVRDVTSVYSYASVEPPRDPLRRGAGERGAGHSTLGDCAHDLVRKVVIAARD